MRVSLFYRLAHGLSRSVIGSRRTYNLFRRIMLASNYLLRVPHEEDFRLFGAFPNLEGPIIDVGANGGQSIVSFAIYCRKATIFSFEPNPELQCELSWVLSWLKSPGSRLFAIALGDRDGSATLRIPHRGSLPLDAQAAIVPDTISSDGIHHFEVEVRRFDSLTSRELGTDRDPEVVKIDVEGFEGPVVRGMLGMLRRAEPLIMFERSSSFQEVKDALTPLDYCLYDYDPSQNRLTPCGNDEAVLNVFALSPIWRQKCRENGLID